ncbi:MAG: epoxyqueuosine reductase [Desulfomonile tiedjei]|nr:epoxyqueuosine reductase [Desulfomonile tiedjei]
MTSEKIKKFARKCGADLVGVADLELLKGIDTEPADLLEGYSRAISIGVRLADGVIDPIVDRPTPLYQQHYLKVNALLDDIAIRASQYIHEAGGKALPIPASQLLDKTEWRSYISHKAVAIAAGLGWQGKSLLVVNPQCGPRLRLATVLTDLPLIPDPPLKNRCGKCSHCTEACPAQAIKNVNTVRHYADRNEALYFERCVTRVTENAGSLPFIESPICGVCIKVCPWGRKKRGKKSTKGASE